jgi:hypothetical protein
MSILELAGLYSLGIILVVLVCLLGRTFRDTDDDYEAHNPNFWEDEDWRDYQYTREINRP